MANPIVKYHSLHIHKGLLKVGVSVYPAETDRCYKLHYVSKAIIPETGIPEGLEGEDLQACLDSLPHIWELNPAFTHFIRIDPSLTKTQLEQEIQRIFTPDLLTSADAFLSTRGKEERADFSRFRKMMANAEVLGNGLVLPKDADFKAILEAKHNDFKDFAGELDGKGKILPYEGGTIDVGQSAIDDRGSSSDISEKTAVEGSNAANEAGEITSVSFWLSISNPTLGDIWFGTFSASGDVLTCRDSESTGPQAFGSPQVASGLHISVEVGDYIGTCSRTAHSTAIERDLTGYDHIWWVNGEYIDPSDSTTFYNFAADTISLYGEGEAAVTEKQSSDTGSGADAKASGNPVATLTKTETGAGVEAHLGRDIHLGETGGGLDAVAQAEAILTRAETGAGVEALLDRAIVLIEAGAGLDALEDLIATILGTETGAGIDVSIELSQLIEKLSSDSGSGIDSRVALLAALLRSDLGAGVEVGIPALYEYCNTGETASIIFGYDNWLAQTFTPLKSHTIKSVKFLLDKTGNVGTLGVGIRATDVDGFPTGEDLCSGTTDGDTLPEHTGNPDDAEWREISLGNGYYLTAGVKYAVYIKAVNLVMPDWPYIWLAYPGDYDRGEFCESFYGGAYWQIVYGRLSDLMFEEWGVSSVASLSAILLGGEDGTGADARVAFLVTHLRSELGSGIEALLDRVIALIESGSGEEASEQGVALQGSDSGFCGEILEG
jgi:hypothetical protein